MPVELEQLITSLTKLNSNTPKTFSSVINMVFCSFLPFQLFKELPYLKIDSLLVFIHVVYLYSCITIISYNYIF